MTKLPMTNIGIICQHKDAGCWKVSTNGGASTVPAALQHLWVLLSVAIFEITCNTKTLGGVPLSAS